MPPSGECFAPACENTSVLKQQHTSSLRFSNWRRGDPAAGAEVRPPGWACRSTCGHCGVAAHARAQEVPARCVAAYELFRL